jgi:RNA-directed DNA polymerase
VRWLVKQEDFTPHPDKTRVLRRGRQQEVTGVVVNDKPGVDRQTLKRFRALLHQLDKTGPEGKRWGASADVLASAVGYAHFVAMVDPLKGRALELKARELERRYGRRPPPTPPTPPPAATAAPAPEPTPATPTEPAPAPSDAPKKKWWKLF